MFSAEGLRGYVIDARKIVKNGMNEVKEFLTILKVLMTSIPNKVNIKCITHTKVIKRQQCCILCPNLPL